MWASPPTLSVIVVIYLNQLSSLHRTKASPVQGEVSAEQADGGVVAENGANLHWAMANSYAILRNPSVIIGSEEPILTAPFTQGLATVAAWRLTDA